MIGFFLKPQYRQDLASCAVIFPLFAIISLSMPLFGYMAWKTVVPPDAPEWLLGVPFWLWLTWLAMQWFSLVQIIRAEPRRTNSVGVFHLIQAAFLAMAFVIPAVSNEIHDLSYLPMMFVCVETAVLIFLVNYFLLALGTWTRPSWHAVSALALAVASSFYELWSANHPVHH